MSGTVGKRSSTRGLAVWHLAIWLIGRQPSDAVLQEKSSLKLKRFDELGVLKIIKILALRGEDPCLTTVKLSTSQARGHDSGWQAEQVNFSIQLPSQEESGS